MRLSAYTRGGADVITMQQVRREDLREDETEWSQVSVGDLLRRAREGDSPAWEEIVRRYSSVVFATVRSFRLQDADVFDAVQMTWLRLAENSHRVQFPERLA